VFRVFAKNPRNVWKVTRAPVRVHRLSGGGAVDGGSDGTHQGVMRCLSCGQGDRGPSPHRNPERPLLKEEETRT